jgi:hypothetical protein
VSTTLRMPPAGWTPKVEQSTSAIDPSALALELGLHVAIPRKKELSVTPSNNGAGRHITVDLHPWQKQVSSIFQAGDYLHILLIHGTKTFIGENGKPQPILKEHWDTYESIMDAGSLKALRAWEQEGWNIFLCIAVFDRAKIDSILALPYAERTTRRTPANIAAVNGKHVIRAVTIDCDSDGAASLVKIQAAVKANEIPAPTIVIQSSTPKPDSGGSPKYQFWWAVKDFTLAQQAALNEALQQTFGGDDHAKDTVRVLRLAGFVNNQPEKYPHKPVVTLVQTPKDGGCERFTFDQFKLPVEVKVAPVDRPKASSAQMEFYCNQIEENCAEAGFELGKRQPYFDGGFKYVQACPLGANHSVGQPTDPKTCLTVLPNGARDFMCQHTHEDDARIDWEWFKNFINESAGKELDWTEKGMLIVPEQEVKAPDAPDALSALVSEAEAAMDEQMDAFAQLQEECAQIQSEPLTPYPVDSWDGTPYRDFARTGRCEGTENQNFLPAEWLINCLMTYVGAICGHRISPAFNPKLKARFITILLSEIGGIGKDTVQEMTSAVFDGTDLIRLHGLPEYQRIGCFKSDFASERAMIQAQAANPITLQVYNEFTTLIEKTGIQGSGQAFINLLLHYADSSEPKWSAIKGEGIPENAPAEVEVSLIGFTTKKRWDGMQVDLETFLQRGNIIPTEETRLVADLVMPDFSKIQEAILPRIGLLETHKLCWDFTPDAKKMFREWFQSLQDRKAASRAAGTDEDESEVYGRIQVYALRIIGHLALWLGELPETANIRIAPEAEKTGDRYDGRIIVTNEERKHVWPVVVTADIVARALRVADYEMLARARAIPPKGSVISALVENTIRKWTFTHKKIRWPVLLRKSHLRERFGSKICKDAVLQLAHLGDILISTHPEYHEKQNDWIIQWIGGTTELIPITRGGRRKGAGRKPRKEA